MKINKNIFVLLPALLLLSSCGFGLKEAVMGDEYNSRVWNENYYRVWDDKIDVHSENNKITEVVERDLDIDRDKVFFSYADPAFGICEPQYNEYVYTSDDIYSDVAYGINHNMSNIDSSFKYNVTSKLFDGRLFCGGRYEKARVQVAPSNNKAEEAGLKDGFGRLFKKELRTADYFAMNFKCSADYKSDKSISIPAHRSSIALRISFYLKNETGYTQSVVKYRLENEHSVPANTGDGDRTNQYMFFGFKLSSSDEDHYLDITRCVGFSFQYELIEDSYVSHYDLGHSVLLYEVMFPHSTWY